MSPARAPTQLSLGLSSTARSKDVVETRHIAPSTSIVRVTQLLLGLTSSHTRPTKNSTRAGVEIHAPTTSVHAPTTSIHAPTTSVHAPTTSADAVSRANDVDTRTVDVDTRADDVGTRANDVSRHCFTRRQREHCRRRYTRRRREYTRRHTVVVVSDVSDVCVSSSYVVFCSSHLSSTALQVPPWSCV